MKGHMGTVKSAIAELTDETNSARGFSLPLVAYSLGGVFGFVPLPYLKKFSSDFAKFLQFVDRWHLVPASRPLATPLLPPFLGRLSILPAMSCSRFFYMPFIRRYGIVSKRGLFFFFSLERVV